MSNIVITGGGRGLGLELVRQFTKLPKSQISKVFVTTRGNPSSELEEAIRSFEGRVINIHCEITDEASVNKAASDIQSQLAGEPLDILINNVGVMPIVPGGIRAQTGQELSKTFDVNVVAAHRMTLALLPSFTGSKVKKIVMVSTTVGSISYANRYSQSPTPSYKITKAALNMLMVQFSIELESEGFTVFSSSPGWLKTDMGSQYADLEPEVGASALKDLILNADRTANGKFLNIHVKGWEHAEGPNQYDGGEAPW